MTGSQPPGNYPPPPGNFPPPPGNFPPPPPPPMESGGYGPPAGYAPQSDYPVQVSFYQPMHSSRLLAGFSIPFFLIRYILLIPAFFCLYFVGIVAAFAAWFACWAVLFTGHYPDGFFRFVSGTLRWQTRVSAYMYGLTDQYPPFRLAQ